MLLFAISPDDILRVTNSPNSNTFNATNEPHRTYTSEGFRNLGYDPKNTLVANRVWHRNDVDGEPDFGFGYSALTKLHKKISYENAFYCNVRLYGGTIAPTTSGTLFDFGDLKFGYNGRMFTVNGRDAFEFQITDSGTTGVVNNNIEFEFISGEANIYLNGYLVYTMALPTDLKISYVEHYSSDHIGYRHIIMYNDSGTELNERQGRMRLRSVSLDAATANLDMSLRAGVDDLGTSLKLVPLDQDGFARYLNNGGPTNNSGFVFGNKENSFIKARFTMPVVSEGMIPKGSLISAVARREENSVEKLGVVLKGDVESDVFDIGVGKWTFMSFACSVANLEFSAILRYPNVIKDSVYVAKSNGIDIYRPPASTEESEEISYLTRAVVPAYFENQHVTTYVYASLGNMHKVNTLEFENQDVTSYTYQGHTEMTSAKVKPASFENSNVTSFVADDSNLPG